MNLFHRLFRKNKENIDISINDILLSVHPPLNTILLSINPDGLSTYLSDRNQAISWYHKKNFPLQDHLTDLGADWFYTMSCSAENDAVWKEAWSGFHFALEGYLHLNKKNKIADTCWHIGRSHSALGQYDLASLFFDTGRLLSKENNEIELFNRIILEQAVLAKLTQQNEKIKTAMNRMVETFFPAGQPLPSAKSAALTLFKEGDKHQQWVDKNGKPVESSLIYASGFYEVSIELNRILKDKMGIAFILTNFGTLWNKLGKKERALNCWKEALTNFTVIGDENNIRRINQWIKEL